MEFNLPEVHSEIFGRHLMQRYNLGEFFGELSKKANHRIHSEEFSVLANNFPAIWGSLGLRLRDIDYCVRLIAVAGRNLDSRHFMYPWLLGFLLALKLKNVTLYRQFTEGRCQAAKVIDYIDDILPPQARVEEVRRVLELTEALLYSSELSYSDLQNRTPSALSQLRLLKGGEDLTHPEYLSERTRLADDNRASWLLETIESGLYGSSMHGATSILAELIDLHQGIVRR